MRFTSFFTSALISLIILALVVAIGARADDGNTAPPAPAEDTFTFEAHDRRDPFTFTKTVPKITEVSASQPGDVEHNSNRMDAAQIAAKREALRQIAALAEQRLMDYHYSEAASACDTGLDELRDIRVDEYKELQSGRDELLRLHKVALRGKAREEVERDFIIANYHLTGIVASQRMPRAIVNGKVITVGDTISANAQDPGALVFSIDPQQITVVYRNFRVALAVDK